jgi:hypothetical protein
MSFQYSRAGGVKAISCHRNATKSGMLKIFKIQLHFSLQWGMGWVALFAGDGVIKSPNLDHRFRHHEV